MIPRDSFWNGRHIALLYPLPDAATNPSLIALLKALRKSGVRISFFTRRKRKYCLEDAGEILPFPAEIRRWSGSTMETLVNWLNLLRGSMAGRRILFGTRYDLIIGVNSGGIIAASRYGSAFGVPFVYLSYEIFFRDELANAGDIAEKEEEIRASQKAQLVIIQDEERAGMLIRENGIHPQRTFLLPVAPEADANTGKRDILRRKFGIPPNKKIVIHAGSFEEWTCATELLNSIEHWPAECVLVVHAKYHSRDLKRYRKRLGKNVTGRVVFSGDPLPPEEYGKMLASADIGLVLYKGVTGSRHAKYLGRNITTIGLSSGKFSSYMKYGLPTVSFRQETYRRLLHQYRFGEDVDDFHDIPSALARIMREYDTYSEQARKLFQEKLCFDLYWPSLQSRLARIIRREQATDTRDERDG
jgi:hypothetical protein